MVPLQGNKRETIRKFFHKKTFDLHHFFKIQNLNIRSKEKTKETIKQKTKEKESFMQMLCIRSIYVWAEL